MVEVHLNHMAVLVSAAVHFLLGGLWYSPVLFAKPWMRVVGLSEEDMKKGASPMPYAIAFAASLFSAYALGCVLSAVQATSVWDGLSIGLMTGVGFVLPAGMHYAFESRPLKLYVINFGYSVAGLGIMGVILTMWK